ncbi:zinc ribbon domain-containing protein [Bifidobacterium scaligerum]|uniref:Zinc ribbon domain-containing protein n=2 Tax=Bifidobacterium scaligerum TaxID=2052656 RepID=A0A2M9HPI8_9BIFI|nr:zinc ribbon domain-containing protein [Bifidobacterium scaligerum]
MPNVGVPQPYAQQPSQPQQPYAPSVSSVPGVSGQAMPAQAVPGQSAAPQGQATGQWGGAAVPPMSGVPNGAGNGKNNGHKRNIAAIIIAIVVVVALVAGSVAGFFVWRNWKAGKEETTSQTAKSKSKTKSKTKSKSKDNTKTEESEPKSTMTKAIEVEMVGFSCDYTNSNSWNWVGGAMVSNVIHCWDGDATADSDSSYSSGDSLDGSGEYSFGLWTPALDASKEIHVSMLESGEKEYSEPQVGATYGNNPAVFVFYAVKTKAVGTTPESVHLYAQEVNVETGELSDRIDLKTEEDNLIDYEQGYEYSILAESRDMVAIAKTWHSDESYTTNGDSDTTNVDHTQVMGVTRGKDTAQVLQTFQDKIAVTADSNGYQSMKKTDISVNSTDVSDTYLVEDDTYHLYSVDNNKQIISFPTNYCNPKNSWSCDVYHVWSLGDNQYVVDDQVIDSSTGKVQSLHDLLGLSKDEHIEAKDQFVDGTMYVQTDDYDNNEGRRVFLMGSDLSPTEVLDGSQWARLLLTDGKFMGINYLTKTIYVQTTDEQIIVNAQGESVGNYTLLPVYDDPADCDHTQMEWMMWNKKSDGSNSIIVTIGQAPGDPAPDLPTDSSNSADSSDKSDSDSDSDSSSSSSKKSGSSKSSGDSKSSKSSKSEK